MLSVSVFLDIIKFADFWWKDADVSRTQGVCNVIHIFFGSSLGKVQLSSFITVGYVWQILGSWGSFWPPHQWAQNCPFWIRLRLLLLMTEFSVFMPLPGITPGNSWQRSISLRGYKIIWRTKGREMKTNKY